MTAEDMKLIDESTLRMPANFTSLFNTEIPINEADLESPIQLAVRTNNEKKYTAHIILIKGELGQKWACCVF